MSLGGMLLGAFLSTSVTDVWWFHYQNSPHASLFKALPRSPHGPGSLKEVISNVAAWLYDEHNPVCVLEMSGWWRRGSSQDREKPCLRSSKVSTPQPGQTLVMGTIVGLIVQ